MTQAVPRLPTLIPAARLARRTAVSRLDPDPTAAAKAAIAVSPAPVTSYTLRAVVGTPTRHNPFSALSKSDIPSPPRVTTNGSRAKLSITCRAESFNQQSPSTGVPTSCASSRAFGMSMVAPQYFLRFTVFGSYDDRNAALAGCGKNRVGDTLCWYAFHVVRAQNHLDVVDRRANHASKVIFNIAADRRSRFLIQSKDLPTMSNTAAAQVFTAIADGGTPVVVNRSLVSAAGNPTNFWLNTVISGNGATHGIDLRFKTANASDATDIINSAGNGIPQMFFG